MDATSFTENCSHFVFIKGFVINVFENKCARLVQVHLIKKRLHCFRLRLFLFIEFCRTATNDCVSAWRPHPNVFDSALSCCDIFCCLGLLLVTIAFYDFSNNSISPVFPRAIFALENIFRIITAWIEFENIGINSRHKLFESIHGNNIVESLWIIKFLAKLILFRFLTFRFLVAFCFCLKH